jgi:hypothetical protein
MLVIRVVHDPLLYWQVVLGPPIDNALHLVEQLVAIPDALVMRGEHPAGAVGVFLEHPKALGFVHTEPAV